MDSYRYRVLKKVFRDGCIADYINPECILHTEISHNGTRLVVWYLEHQKVTEIFPLVKLEEELKLRKKLEEKKKKQEVD